MVRRWYDRPARRPRCRRCGKAIFSTEVEARLELTRPLREDEPPLVRVYRCGPVFHVTIRSRG